MASHFLCLFLWKMTAVGGGVSNFVVTSWLNGRSKWVTKRRWRPVWLSTGSASWLCLFNRGFLGFWWTRKSSLLNTHYILYRLLFSSIIYGFLWGTHDVQGKKKEEEKQTMKYLKCEVWEEVVETQQLSAGAIFFNWQSGLRGLACLVGKSDLRWK